jgi:hypothetical protein
MKDTNNTINIRVRKKECMFSFGEQNISKDDRIYGDICLNEWLTKILKNAYKKKKLKSRK